MAIQDDFTIYPYSKVIRHTSGTTVYTVTAFYSWLMDTFDEPGYMTYQRPMKYDTPTSFTMLNGWFLDDGDGSNILQYLTGGSILTSGQGTVDDPVYMLDMDNLTAFVSSDKDKTITDDGSDVGPLLAYKNNYASAGLARIWVRDTNSNGQIADNSVIATTSGTGGGNANGASASGDDIYTNIYTIAAFPGSPNPQVYIYQDHPQSGARVRIAEWSAFTNWDRGSIDVLIPVQYAGTLIDSGNVTVLVRQTGDTFTYVVSDLSSGSRTPVATETQADTVNITKGEHYLLYDGGSAGAFSAGDVIQDTATNSGTPPSWYAEVVDVTEFSVNTTGVLTLRGLRGSISDNDAIYVGTTQKATANGTPGDTYTTASAVTTQLTVGLTCTGSTSGAKRILRGLDDGEDAYVFEVDTSVTGSSRNAYYKDFSASETITDTGTGSITNQASASTTLIAGYSDITVAHINGTVACDTFSGTFTIGERVTWSGGGPAIIVKTDGSSSITLANVEDETGLTTDNLTITGDISGATCLTNGTGGLVDTNTENYAFTQQSAYPYSVFIEGGSIYNAGRDLDDIYAYLQFICRDGQDISTRKFYTSDGSSITEVAAEEYLKADASYTATKAAPFGTLAGGVFFGAQGVWIQGMDSSDDNNIKLTDHNGNLREPYTSVTVTVSNTRADDVIAVYLEDGTTGLPDKDTYTSHATNNVQSDSTFDKDSGSFPIDTPSSGTFIVVDSSANEEHRYRYVSWSGGTLTLPTERTGTATSGSSGQTLVDSAATFQTWGIQRGDIIRNVTDSGWGYVESVNSETQLTTTQLTTAGKDWASGDSYEINSLVVTYDSNDTFFISYMDTIETTGTDASPGSETVSLLYTADRPVVVRVRNVTAATPIQPFVTTSDITSAGMSVSVIRTKDEVYT
jgi:hypothetical protein